MIIFKICSFQFLFLDTANDRSILPANDGYQRARILIETSDNNNIKQEEHSTTTTTTTIIQHQTIDDINKNIKQRNYQKIKKNKRKCIPKILDS